MLLRMSKAYSRVGISTPRTHLLLSLCSAALLAVGFARPGWWWFAHVALVPLSLLSLRSTRRRHLIWTTYVVGVLWWLMMVSWLSAVTVGGYFCLCLYLGLYWPMFALALRRVHRSVGGRSWLAVPLVWVSLEFIRANLLAGGFGWFSLGHAMAPFTPMAKPPLMAQCADLFGEFGVSVLVAMTSGMCVDLLTRSWRKTGWSRWRLSPAMNSYMIWMMLTTGAVFYGLYRVRTTVLTGPSLSVAVIQSNVPQDNKNQPTAESMAKDWQRLIELTMQAAQEASPAVMVWPETMVPAALNADALAYYRQAPTGERGYEVFNQQIQQWASQLKTHFLVGAHAKFGWRTVEGRDGARYMLPERRFNSVYHIAPDGNAGDLPRYDKMHLVPFGEYIPWVGAWPWLKHQFMVYLSPYSVDYTVSAGLDRTVFEIQHQGQTYRVAAPICFEDTVSRVVLPMVYHKDGRKRADLLVNVTNDGWYAGTVAGVAHLQNATLRCIENRVPMARSVNTGVSGFIDSTGRITSWVQVAGKTQQVDGWAVYPMQLDGRKTLFGRWGQIPMMCWTGVTGALLLVGMRQHGKL